VAASERYAFLDVVRGIAVIWMIQVHVTNVLLAPSLRSGFWFDVLNISNGYVAPTFIFCAGAGLWIALSRKGAKYLAFGADLRDYLRRLAYILFWAYALHVPFYSLERMLIARSEEILPWLQVDVLQAIVYSSIAALGVFLVLRDLRRATWAFGILAALVMSTTWAVWKAPPSAILPWPIAYAVSPAPASPFPLLPWSAYLFAGAFVTGLFMTSTNKRRFAQWMFVIGLVGPFVAFLSMRFGPPMPWDDVWWRTSPGVHLFRIFATLFLLGALFPLEERLRSSRTGKLLQTIGNESLFMYVGHLLVVYGPMADLLERATGQRTFGYDVVAATWIIVTAAFIALMTVWHKLKRERPALAQRLIVIQIVWMVLSFLLWPM
jgi:uncharacterized membrane protein